MKLQHRKNAYATHQPVLIHCIKNTPKGKVLEFGSGDGSTQLLHTLAPGRVMTIDHDPKWLQALNEYSTGVIACMTFEEMLAYCKGMDTPVAMAFLDQGDWGSREDCAKELKDKADLVIVHDCDAYGDLVRNGILEKGRLAALFKFSKVFYPPEPWAAITGPPTFVGSNTIDVSKWEIDMEINEI